MSRNTFILAAVDREDSGPDICGTASQTLSVVIGDAFGGSSPLTFSGDWLVANNCDVNSNTVLMADGNGGTADWAYDVLDRNTIMTFHDSSTRTNVFNAASDVIGYTDENGSVFTNTPDVLGRITAAAVAPAAGVAGNAALPATPGTLAQGFQFDGLSRPTFGRDSVGTVGVGYLVNADVGFTRDSIDRVLEEQQTYVSDTRYITHNAWTSYAGTGFTFPSGRQIDKSFDALYRKNAINEASDGSSIAAWQFFGGRTATVTLGNGIVTSFMNDTKTRSAIQLGQTTPAWGSISTDQLGYDGSARPIGKRHSLSGSVIVGFTSAYDPSSNKLFERALHAESRSALYSTDSMDRLLQYLRGTLATGGGSITTPIALPNTNASQSYALDGLGNWRNTDITPEGGASQLQVRTHNKLNQLLAFGVAPASTPVLYDHGNNTGANASRGNGNIINDGTRACVFDALNRLRRVNRVSGGVPVALYVYDALHRRIDRAVFAAVSGTVPASESRYLLDGQQIVEELIGATGSPRIQYVWGQYIDELIQLKALANIGPQPLAAGSYYLLSDLLYRSAALTNSTGGIVETYDTSAYGDTLLFSAGGGTGGAWFSDSDTQAAYSACRYVFTGREFDAETGIYFYRDRWYGPSLGRFLSRDGATPTTNVSLYLYAACSPAVYTDPNGLDARPPFQPPTGSDELFTYVRDSTGATFRYPNKCTVVVVISHDIAALAHPTVKNSQCPSSAIGSLSCYANYENYTYDHNSSLLLREGRIRGFPRIAGPVGPGEATAQSWPENFNPKDVRGVGLSNAPTAYNAGKGAGDANWEALLSDTYAAAINQAKAFITNPSAKCPCEKVDVYFVYEKKMAILPGTDNDELSWINEHFKVGGHAVPLVNTHFVVSQESSQPVVAQTAFLAPLYTGRGF